MKPTQPTVLQALALAGARVYAGIHFLEGCTAGLRMGNQVADWVYSSYLRP
jgi:hypothetical protein